MKKIISSFITVTLLLSIPLVMSIPGYSEDSYRFVLKWGSSGSGDGQFPNPHGVAVDSDGNIYVTDRGNLRIQKFDPDGIFITKWGIGSDPVGVAIDSKDNVYVTVIYSHMIHKFDSDGNFITGWGSYGSGDGQLYYPWGVAVDSNGNVYVVDRYNDRIQKFSSVDGINYTYVTQWGEYGTGNGQFNDPLCIAVDSNGNVYVSEYLDYRIQKFSSVDGINYTYVTQWGEYGTGNGQLRGGVMGIAVDSKDNVYVTDYRSHRFQKFDSDGGFLGWWGADRTPFTGWHGPLTNISGGVRGAGDGQFYSPIDVAVDSHGNVYVAEVRNFRIQKFAPTNQPPVAFCKDIEIHVDENCQATITAADVDDGSSDPDEDEITLSVDNIGPFSLGEHYINLTVTDSHGESDTCTATVTVIDDTPPTIQLSDPICVNVGEDKMANKLTVSAEDNCSEPVDPSINKIEVYNKRGILIRASRIYGIFGNDIFVYPNARGWSITVIATAVDESGNTTTQIINKSLIKCKE